MSDRYFTALMRVVHDRIRALESARDDHDRRIANIFREAKVTKLHDREAEAEVEADGLESKRISWLARAGKQREWDPPTEDERVIMISPNGDPGQAFILPGGFSNKFPQNHDKAGEHRRSVGDKVKTTTTEKDKVSETESVTVSQESDKHSIAAGTSSTHRVEADKITNDTPQLIGTKDAHFATG